MRKLIATILVSGAALLPTTACSQRNNEGVGTSRSEPAAVSGKQSPPARNSEITYTCPMHPEVIQSSSGKCPKCGMDLVKKQ